MALVAFDLDKTLGYFKHISPWGDFFSLDTLENPFNLDINPEFKLSDSLRKKLRMVETRFIEAVLADKRLLRSILRPNIDYMIRPIIKAKRANKVRAVIMYSNTWSTWTMIFAKRLIETIYECKGLFDATIDATHSVRMTDWAVIEGGEPIKTFRVLRKIFRNICKVKGTIDPKDVLFIDERKMDHHLHGDVPNGLTYLKPTQFSPMLSDTVKKLAFVTGVEVMHECGLLKDTEYLESPIFDCNKFGKNNTMFRLTNILTLFEMAEEYIRKAGSNGEVFNSDSTLIKRTIAKYLLKF